MGAEYVGVVYGTADRRIRRIIVPDDDRELSLKGHLASDETMVRIVRSTFRQIGDLPAVAMSLGLSSS